MKTIIQKTISWFFTASMMLAVIPFKVLVSAEEENEEDICRETGGFGGQEALRKVEGSPVKTLRDATV